jgi:hypothetical protein
MRENLSTIALTLEFVRGFVSDEDRLSRVDRHLLVVDVEGYIESRYSVDWHNIFIPGLLVTLMLPLLLHSCLVGWISSWPKMAHVVDMLATTTSRPGQPCPSLSGYTDLARPYSVLAFCYASRKGVITLQAVSVYRHPAEQE